MDKNVIPLTEQLVKRTDYWLFYRKILRLRGYRPLKRVMEFIYDGNKPVALTRFIFKHPEKGYFTFHVSKNFALYFTMKRPDKERVYSKYCTNLGELEAELMAFFKHSKPVLQDYKVMSINRKTWPLLI